MRLAAERLVERPAPLTAFGLVRRRAEPTDGLVDIAEPGRQLERPRVGHRKLVEPPVGPHGEHRMMKRFFRDDGEGARAVGTRLGVASSRRTRYERLDERRTVTRRLGVLAKSEQRLFTSGIFRNEPNVLLGCPRGAPQRATKESGELIA